MRQRQISSVPDGITDRSRNVLSVGLDSTFTDDEFHPPGRDRRADGGKSQPGADQAKSAPGLGRRTAPARGAKPYSGGVSNCPLGVSFCLMAAPAQTGG